ncbi:MAG TPA: tRNA (adenosine(37)-N6)-threonylcarbamoyltransferase complex dimerization subunit type 1 TsaB [Gemmatimonadales bacterium]|nr:tRNA (adenosine(37)-N6)-threonylcarbamoyltransferase complex dimerization subunit type 1 TsaB [Gemmatimonadales bacterium]
MWLALDTATDLASVALGTRGGDSVTEEQVAGARRHAAALLPLIQKLLERSGGTLDDVEGIVVSDGPGSFTGLRVGASVAKALVHARGMPLWTAPSLLVRAQGVAQTGALVLAISNALRGEVYAAAYRFTPEAIRTELIPSVRKPEDIVAGDLRPDIIVGEAPAGAVALLEQWTGGAVIGPPEGAPHAARLLELVGRPGGAHQIEAVTQWEPLYGRPAEAQARWETAHGRPLPDSVGSPG